MKKIIIPIFILLMISLARAQEAKFFYDDKGRRDPFWPLVTVGGAIMSYETEVFISDMVLEGIIVEGPKNSLAIINGIIVKPNDTIGQYKVKEVRRDAVILMKGSEIFTLKLKKEE